MVSQDGENRPVLGASTKDAGSDSGVEEDVSFNVEGPVTHDHLVDLIESPAWKVLLFKIVDAERLDPWDIDIVKLSDSYLKKINAMNEFSFHLPANAILAASIFLAFKSRKVNLSLLLPQAQDELAGFIESDLLDLAMGADPSVVLEPEITAPLKRVPQNRVTLEELVNAVQLIMDRKKIQKPKLDQAQHVESLFSNLRVSGIDINQQISRTYSNISSLADSQGLVRFSELVKPDIELAGPVRRLRSNFINGIKHMPVRFTPAETAGDS